MIGPALQRLLSNLGGLDDRSPYEEAVFHELSTLAMSVRPDDYVHLLDFDVPHEQRFSLTLIGESGQPEPLGEFGPTRGMGHVFVKSNGLQMSRMVDSGPIDIVRLRCTATNCPNKRL